MGKDKPLTDFSATESETSGNEELSDEADPTPEPAVSTYQWLAEPAACPQCGESTNRLWRDGSDAVCPDCKSW